jgi:hypothetical protein
MLADERVKEIGGLFALLLVVLILELTFYRREIPSIQKGILPYFLSITTTTL